MAVNLLQRAPLLVSSDWLKSNLTKPNLVIYDGSWNSMFPTRQHAGIEWAQCRLPDARFFDIDEVADKSTSLPNMLPKPETFSMKMSADGVQNDSHVIVYDSKGIFASARLYWTFKVFGHDEVSILDGGLPDWVDKNYPVHTEKDPLPKPHKTIYKAGFRPNLIKSFEQMEAIVKSKTWQIVDARSKGRFEGKLPEPRPIPSGHMPGSFSVPFAEVLDASGRHFLPSEQLQKMFKEVGVNPEKPIVTSCGGGVTATLLLMALQLVNVPIENLSLYDGSWAEWGSRSQNIEQRGPVSTESK